MAWLILVAGAVAGGLQLPSGHVWRRVKAACTPNEVTRDAWAILAAWVVVCLGYWAWAKPVMLPSLPDVLGALPGLWWEEGLGPALASSWVVNVEALALSTAVSLPLAYLSRTPVVRPLAVGLSKLRFLSPAVFFLVLIFLASSGHQVKLLMLALGESFFLVTTMTNVVAAIPADQFDDARTLRMSEWQATWYVVVRGTLPQALDAVRDNAAMGWSMLTMVEGIVRSEGGVGVLLLNNQHHMNLAEVSAIAAVVVAVGLTQDAAIGWFRRGACPWASIAVERSR